MPETPQPTDEVTGECIDADAFSELFFHPQKNRQDIWLQMVKIVSMVSRRVVFPRGADRQGIRGDCLLHAMDVIPTYDPIQRTAFSFFFTVIFNEMTKLLGKKQPEHVNYIPELSNRGRAVGGEHCGERFTLDDMFTAGDDLSPKQKSMLENEENNPRNWVSYRLPEACRGRADKYFQKTLGRARALHRETESQAEKATTAVMIETLRQCRQALWGDPHD